MVIYTGADATAPQLTQMFAGSPDVKGVVHRQGMEVPKMLHDLATELRFEFIII